MEPVTIGLIAASIISGIIGAATSSSSAKAQSKVLKEGQDESRILNEKQMKESKRQFNTQMAFGREQFEEGKKQFDETMATNKEQTAYQRFQNRFDRFGQLMNQNENLKNLFINRISGLRG